MRISDWSSDVCSSDLYGSYPLAIAAYNAGPGNVNKWLAANGDPRTGTVDMIGWIEAIPFTETRNYVQRVLENAVVYDLLAPEKARSRGPARLSWYPGKAPPGQARWEGRRVGKGGGGQGEYGWWPCHEKKKNQ